MSKIAFSRLRRIAWALLLLTAFVTFGAAQEERPHVLILYSYSSNTAPFQAIGAAFKTALAREIGKPVQFYEEPLNLDRYLDPALEIAYAELLGKRSTKYGFDLVVPIGGPAAKFVVQHREQAFPGIPIEFLEVDGRVVSYELLRRNGTFIVQPFSSVGWVEDILKIAPDTTHIVYVAGDSILERFWTNTHRRELRVFRNRINFTWLEGLSIGQIQKRVSAFPPHSFILVGLMIEDAEGLTYSGDEGLQRLHEIANAPIYGLLWSQMGKGIVGGRLYQDRDMGTRAASAAVRILRGEPVASIPEQILPIGSPVYDWRELKRWGISEDRLPPGSSILFREPTVWRRYRWYIAGIVFFAVIETLLIAGLLANLLRRRRIEQSLRQSEQKFRRLYESMMDAFVSVDMSGRIWEYNPSYQDLLGYSEEELRQLTYVELTPEKWHEFESRVIHEQVLPLGFSDVYEKEYRRKDGTSFPVELRTFLMKDETGNPIGMWAIVRDVTERKQAEEALRISENRFRQVAELVSDFVWEVDVNGLYTYTSPSVEKILGYSDGEMVGKMHFYDLFAPDVREQLKDAAFQAFAQQQHFQASPNTNISKTGKVVHLETNGIPILDNAGNLLGYRGADMNVTEKRQSEMETQLLRQELGLFSRVATVGELTASIAHEINQPLAAVLNNAQAALNLMERGALDPKELKEIFNDIIADNQRAADVIRSLRSMLRRETSMHQPLPLNDLIRDVASIVRSDALTRRVPVSLDFGSQLPSVKGDRVQLQQVILNLIVNAFDAMNSSEHPGTLRIRTLATEAEVVLSVVDSGPGIPADKLDAIFEPFFTTKKEGLGIGLALSRTIITAHKGRLWAENNPEGGATFHIALPAIKT